MDYTVLEGSEKLIKKYKEENPNNSFNIINTLFEDYIIEKKFDLIIMGFILEHVNSPVNILKHFKKFLDINGKMILCVPNAESMNRRLGIYAGLLDDILKLSEHDKESGHVRYYTVDTFKKDIEDSGLKIKKLEGIYLKPFTTNQMISLNFDQKILDALCLLGEVYPELSLGLMAECEV